MGDIDLDDRGSKSRSQRDPRSAHNGASNIGAKIELFLKNNLNGNSR
jgi:hypothetical protein